MCRRLLSDILQTEGMTLHARMQGSGLLGQSSRPFFEARVRKSLDETMLSSAAHSKLFYFWIFDEMLKIRRIMTIFFPLFSTS